MYEYVNSGPIKIYTIILKREKYTCNIIRCCSLLFSLYCIGSGSCTGLGSCSYISSFTAVSSHKNSKSRYYTSQQSYHRFENLFLTSPIFIQAILPKWSREPHRKQDPSFNLHSPKWLLPQCLQASLFAFQTLSTLATSIFEDLK